MYTELDDFSDILIYLYTIHNDNNFFFLFFFFLFFLGGGGGSWAFARESFYPANPQERTLFMI